MTATLPDKAAVHEALRAGLEATHAAMVASAQDSAAGAVHEENRAEGIKDMRSTESSYLARGQAMRAEALADELARVVATRVRAFRDDDPVAPGALVRVEIDDEVRVFYVLGQGGGTNLDVMGAPVTVIAPSSPVGRALVGKRVDDDFTVRIRDEDRDGSILAIA